MAKKRRATSTAKRTKSKRKTSSTKRTAAKTVRTVKAKSPGVAKPREKNPEKLRGRFALDFAAVRDEATPLRESVAASADQPAESNPALLRLKALMARDQITAAPVDAARANWTPLGPLAVPNGQTYGGARVL